MYRREIELKNNPDLAAEMDQHLTGQNASFEAPSSTTHLIDSLAVDSGATDLESASELGPSNCFIGSLFKFRGTSFSSMNMHKKV